MAYCGDVAVYAGGSKDLLVCLAGAFGDFGLGSAASPVGHARPVVLVEGTKVLREVLQLGS